MHVGTIGGSHYSHYGSGSNYLCMPMVPIYEEYTPAADTLRGLLYSSEYQVHDDSTRLRSKHDHAPVCAVCQAPKGTSSALMIPARNVCPSDWRLEYKGYLMAEYWNHKRTQYVCVDTDLEIEPGTGGDQNGALLYRVEARALTGGGLLFGPYVQGRELTCAVCTI